MVPRQALAEQIDLHDPGWPLLGTLTEVVLRAGTGIPGSRDVFLDALTQLRRQPWNPGVTTLTVVGARAGDSVTSFGTIQSPTEEAVGCPEGLS